MIVKNKIVSVALLIATLGLASGDLFRSGVQAGDIAHVSVAPEFTHHDPNDWINSQPLQLQELRGKVVLLDLWTFDCWNCYRSFPWLKSVEQRFGDSGFTVIGVHTPEFDHERVRANVVRKTREFALEHPVMMDNDYSYWKALHNRYWPTFYLIDKQGRLRARYVGETHRGERRAIDIEAKIAQLLAEPPG